MTLASPGMAPASLSGLAMHTRHRLYPVLLPIGVFVLTRLFAGLLIVTFSKHQIALGPDTIPGLFVFHPTPADPGYLSVISNWDGQWYESIATNGHHVSAAGETPTHDQSWAWAFPPLYPLLVGLVMDVTGFSFALASTLVTCSAGAAAMVLLFRMLERSGGRFLATSGVVLSCCFVSAPLFQATYSESLALLLLLASLTLIRRHSYWLAVLPTTALMFTRLITPVLFVVVVVALVSRVRAAGWHSVRPAQWWGAAVLAGVSVAGAVAWPTLASMLMGDVGRFNRTAKLVSDVKLGWFGEFWDALGFAGVLLVVALLSIPAMVALSRRSAGWGIELRTWSVAYPLFIVSVTTVSGGALRYALLAPTLGLLLIGPLRDGRPSHRQLAVVGVAAALGLFCQYLFVRHMMVIDSQPLVL